MKVGDSWNAVDVRAALQRGERVYKVADDNGKEVVVDEVVLDPMLGMMMASWQKDPEMQRKRIESLEKTLRLTVKNIATNLKRRYPKLSPKDAVREAVSHPIVKEIREYIDSIRNVERS